MIPSELAHETDKTLWNCFHCATTSTEGESEDLESAAENGLNTSVRSAFETTGRGGGLWIGRRGEAGHDGTEIV